jgi:DNA-binding NarL/FixJ family response regulator
VTIGVVVADDQAIVRAGFRLLIDSEPDLTVLGEAADGAEAVAVARKTGPDVVLMDIRMPVMDGIAATRLITDRGLPRVLILATFDLDEYVFAGLRAGASGFMLKDRPPEELLSAIRVIAAGEALLAPNVTRRLPVRPGPGLTAGYIPGCTPNRSASLTTFPAAGRSMEHRVSGHNTQGDSACMTWRYRHWQAEDTGGGGSCSSSCSSSSWRPSRG